MHIIPAASSMQHGGAQKVIDIPPAAGSNNLEIMLGRSDSAGGVPLLVPHLQRKSEVSRWASYSATFNSSSPKKNTSSERLEERGIMEWQAVAALQDGELIAEKPRSKPNPSVEVRETLPDGTEFKAVWSHLRQSGVAKLVTVHFFDSG
jgi:hypothetical protein